MSFIDLGKYVSDVILHFCPGLVGHYPPSPALENNSIDLHLVLLPAGAKQGELLGMNEEIDGLTSAGALAHSTGPCGLAKLFRHAAAIMGLASPANGIRRPIIGRRVAVGVKDFRLEVADESLDFGAGIRAAENGEVAGEVLRQIDGTGA
jgi:hypothetical protein